MNISIIIPSYNSYKTIKKTIEYLNKQTQIKKILEIIIVDSSDDKKTKEIINRIKTDKIIVISSKNKTIPAIGRNLGAESARAEVLAFLDSDVYPAEDWLNNVILAIEKGYKVGGGSVALPNFQKIKLIPIAQYFLQFSEYMNMGVDRCKDFVPSCNMFCEKELFLEAGTFPEIRASEDVLFGLKVRKYSKLWFVPEIKVYHIFRENLKEYLKNQMLLGKYNVIYRRKYYGSLIYKGIIPALLLPLILCLKLYRIVLRVGKTGPGHVFYLIYCFPFLTLGLICWGIGFAEGAIKSHVE